MYPTSRYWRLRNAWHRQHLRQQRVLRVGLKLQEKLSGQKTIGEKICHKKLLGKWVTFNWTLIHALGDCYSQETVAGATEQAKEGWCKEIPDQLLHDWKRLSAPGHLRHGPGRRSRQGNWENHGQVESSFLHGQKWAFGDVSQRGVQLFFGYL